MIVFVRSVVVLFSALLLQRELFAELRIGGVAAEFMLAVAVSSGITGGPERGASFGFGAGLLLDVFLPTPLGLSAAAFAIAAGTVGLAQDSVMETSLLTIAGFPALGTAIGLIAFVFGGVALGFSEVYQSNFGQILATTVLLNALFGFLLIPVTRWMWDLHYTGVTARSPA